MIDTNIKNQIVEKYRQHAQDTGSVELQIAMLSQQIQVLTTHCQENAKDFSSKRGLLKMVSKRKKFLTYLKKSNPAQYQTIVKAMGLRA